MKHLTSSQLCSRLGKKHGLYFYLAGNFYPAIPHSARQIIEQNFALYWEKHFGTDELLANINKDLKDADGEIVALKDIEIFKQFFNEEDL